MARLFGHLVAVTPATASRGARLALRFDTVVANQQRIPVTINLRALASLMEVESAQLPKTGADRGTPQTAWTTDQIGGDVVYRGGGPVARGLQVVGEPLFPDGVLGKVRNDPGSPCRAAVDQNHTSQTLWLFSTDACVRLRGCEDRACGKDKAGGGDHAGVIQGEPGDRERDRVAAAG